MNDLSSRRKISVPFPRKFLVISAREFFSRNFINLYRENGRANFVYLSLCGRFSPSPMAREEKKKTTTMRAAAKGSRTTRKMEGGPSLSLSLVIEESSLKRIFDNFKKIQMTNDLVKLDFRRNEFVSFFFFERLLSRNDNISCHGEIVRIYVPHYRHNTAHEGFLALGCCTPSTRAILRRHVVWPATINRRENQ